MSAIIDFEITGIAPLLMHCDRFANPLAPETIEHKKLTSKRTKTLEDHRAIAKSEWMGSLYYDSELGPYVPSNMIRASLIGGAKLFKLGRHIQRSVIFLESKGFKLEYKGTKDPEKLYGKGEHVDSRSVVVGQARLFRYRPRFPEWTVKGSFSLNEQMLSREDLEKSFEAAGHFCGLGDYRPMFGLYDVKVS